MKCPCGSEFCYLCGKPAGERSSHWRSGKCPRYPTQPARLPPPRQETERDRRHFERDRRHFARTAEALLANSTGDLLGSIGSLVTFPHHAALRSLATLHPGLFVRDPVSTLALRRLAPRQSAHVVSSWKSTLPTTTTCAPVAFLQDRTLLAMLVHPRLRTLGTLDSVLLTDSLLPSLLRLKLRLATPSPTRTTMFPPGRAPHFRPFTGHHPHHNGDHFHLPPPPMVPTPSTHPHHHMGFPSFPGQMTGTRDPFGGHPPPTLFPPTTGTRDPFGGHLHPPQFPPHWNDNDNA
jgi:hypothetical protein